MHLGLGLGLAGYSRRNGGFSPSTLFALAEPGVWFDPSDLTTLFQDTAGATPVTAPGQTVARMNDKSGNGNHATQGITAARPTYSVEPVGGRRNLLLATDTLATQSLTVAAVAHTLAFTGAGTVTLSGASTAGPLVGTGAGNRVTLTFTPTAASLTLTVSGSVTLGQLQLGSTDTAYQRVTTQHDVTEAGVASVGYLWFDGVSNNMVTSSVNFTSTNKMTAFAGYRAIEKTGSTLMFELSSVNSNVGSFSLNQGPIAGTTGFGALMNTGSVVGAQTNPLTIPYTSVASLKLDSALVGTASEISLRMDGVATPLPNISGADSGTGNFGNYPFYIGARGGTLFPFKGHIYSLIARGAATDAPTIASTETWVAGKTGITI